MSENKLPIIESETHNHHKDLDPSAKECNSAIEGTFDQTEEKVLNNKILALTLKISEEHPELLKYLDEMPISVPDENHPAVNLKNLQIYHDSLCVLFKNYKVEHRAKKSVLIV